MKNSVMFKQYLLALTIGLLILAHCALPPEKITPPETTPQTEDAISFMYRSGICNNFI
jgi:hypothetical protein